MNQGLYLFCVARAGLVQGLKIPGLDGLTPVQVEYYREVAAVWAPVSLAEFCGPEAPERLQDLLWVGPRACRHERVVEEVMRRSPVLPLRFGTIFSSGARLADTLAAHYENIRRFLKKVTHREEWAVKGLLDRAAARQAFLDRALAGEAESLAALSPGHRYFKEQRLRGQAERELARWVKETCRGVIQELKHYAQDHRPRRVLPGVGEKGQEVLVNWAFLVNRDRVPEFRACLDAANLRCRAQGLAFGASGPWPPYSFTPTLAATPEP